MKKLLIVTVLITVAAAPGNRYSDDLARRPAAERARLLGTVIRSVGDRCSQPGKTLYRGAYKTLAFWNVACLEGDYEVSINAESSTKVLSCRVKRRLGDGCWTRY